MINYKYPTELEQMKDGDKYQIKFPVGNNNWSTIKTYDSNQCDCKKTTLRDLIDKKRIRIVYNEE